MMNLAAEQVLTQACAEEGLLFLGIASLDVTRDAEKFAAWISEKRHAGMAYLEKYDDIRASPQRLLDGAKAALILALPYGSGDKGLRVRGKESPRIAQYARRADYHRELRAKADRVAAAHLAAQANVGQACTTRTLVDTAPVLERALAKNTRSGFIGKNTCFIHPQHGSYLLLAEILTTAELLPDTPARVDPNQRSPQGGCGSCQRCQVACPTGALNTDYSIDANKCLAYWTIEHRGKIPEEFWPWLAHYWFGCDICQIACPYNRPGTAKAIANKVSPERRDFRTLDLFEVATMSQDFYEKVFGGTPMTRAKREGLQRNALVAMAVRGDERLGQALAQVLAANPRDDLMETVLALRTFKMPKAPVQ